MNRWPGKVWKKQTGNDFLGSGNKLGSSHAISLSQFAATSPSCAPRFVILNPVEVINHYSYRIGPSLK